MAVTLRLTKRLYERPHGAYGHNFHYVLKPEVHQWFVDQGEQYNLWWNNELRPDGYSYLFCFMDIQDPKVAMLFKLTWL
jgi:hypothetical protein